MWCGGVETDPLFFLVCCVILVVIEVVGGVLLSVYCLSRHRPKQLANLRIIRAACRAVVMIGVRPRRVAVVVCSVNFIRFLVCFPAGETTSV